MAEILCPYCCNRFEPNQVHFRLKRPVGEVAENNSGDDDELEDLGGLIGRKKSGSSGGKGSKEGKLFDERLYNYYREFTELDEATAKEYSMQLGFVEGDVSNPDNELEYRLDDMQLFGYVNEVKFRDQILDERLCPYCHKPLIDGAGKHPMLMFSVIGDTNVGKSIYLTILEEMIVKTGCFNANMYFLGTEEEHGNLLGMNRQLIQLMKKPDATDGHVPPIPYQLNYLDPETNERRAVILILCDIPGEKCRDVNNLKEYGRHLKASNGLMFLMDPSRFSAVKNSISKGSELSQTQQMDVVYAINKFLVANSMDSRCNIPTALIITKCDMLAELPYFYADNTRSLLVDPDWVNKHRSFLNQDEIARINNGVRTFLENVGEAPIATAMSDLFTTHSLFINSALGGDIRDERGASVNGQWNPYRVTEAFYWILAENNVLPRRCTQVYRCKDEVRYSKFYFYAWEAKDPMRFEMRSQMARQMADIVDKKGFLKKEIWTLDGQYYS